MRIVFAGTPEFAAHHLQALLDDGRHSVVAVYTQPDRPAGRGKKPATSAVKQLALAHDLALYQPESLKAEPEQLALAELNADLMVVVAYGLLLPQAVLDIPRFGCINVHASLLPAWRGAAPIQRAIEAGDSETGVTVMQMEAGLDTGPALLKVATAIDPHESAGGLFARLQMLGGNALLEAIEQIDAGTIKPEKQDDSRASYAKKLTKAEAQIDWQRPAQEILRKIHAFNPNPGAYTTRAGDRIKLWGAALTARPNPADTQPGTIVAAPSGELWVACGDQSLAITRAQLAGKKSQSAEELLRGHAALLAPGTVLGTAGERQ